MNFKLMINTLLFSTVIMTTGCQENKTNDVASSIPPAVNKTQPQLQGLLSGAISETLNTGGYTYVEIIHNDKPVWAAGPVTVVQKGDEISFNAQMPMNNFHSKTLNRDFDIIYFVDRFTVNGKTGQTNPKVKAALDPHKGDKPHAAAISLKTFSKAENGMSIAEILKDKNKLNAQAIQVRGQVSKFTADVMGKNWIHIRDSSSQQDLTITTDASAALNDIILVKGQLALNKDFGYGYVYEVIVEDAKIDTEAP